VKAFAEPFTRSVWAWSRSVCRLDGWGSTISAVDVVAILLGVVMFAVLYALIYGIDRV
jgi:hypothetical protein